MHNNRRHECTLFSSTHRTHRHTHTHTSPSLTHSLALYMDLWVAFPSHLYKSLLSQRQKASVCERSVTEVPVDFYIEHFWCDQMSPIARPASTVNKYNSKTCFCGICVLLNDLYSWTEGMNYWYWNICMYFCLGLLKLTFHIMRRALSKNATNQDWMLEMLGLINALIHTSMQAGLWSFSTTDRDCDTLWLLGVSLRT